jgi:Adenylate cyclase, family 3 (some proteins contain HAMP domain)
MEAPRIQYTKTIDGVDIAFAVYGAGPALVIPPNITATHLQLEMDREYVRAFYIRLAERIQVVRYDCRGTGMSQRDNVDFSAEASVRDLSAVVDRLGLEHFALYTHTLAGEGPMAFAANNPGRVSSLICWVSETLAILPEVVRQFTEIEPLQRADWDLYCKIAARLMWGWDSPGAELWSELLRAGSSAESRPLAIEEVRRSFRNSWPDQVLVPTLILHVAGADRPTNMARELASSIPTAHIVAIPDTAPRGMHRPRGLPPALFSDSELLTTAIADFVEAAATGPAASVRPPELRLAAMRAILWTDLEGHTPLMQRLGDERGRELLREHERITREALNTHHGTEVKTMGDGFMAWFASVTNAVECAVALQKAFAERNQSASEPLQVRIGLNAGEPIEEDGDLFGSTVILAARIAASAQGGEVLVSLVVRELSAGKGFLFADRGEFVAKGFDEPVRVYEVSWRHTTASL